MAKSRRQIILDTISDLLTDFAGYDRDDDEELPRGQIEEALNADEIDIDEITAHFREELEGALVR